MPTDVPCDPVDEVLENVAAASLSMQRTDDVTRDTVEPKEGEQSLK